MRFLVAICFIGTCQGADSYSITIRKADRQLDLYLNGTLKTSYRIALGTSPIGAKAREGDRGTPEGRYYICTKNKNSRFHLSLGLSYPNEDDALAGLNSKLIDEKTYTRICTAIRNRKQPPWNTALGGEIMIHGCGTSTDWTWGCIALENPDIETLFKVLELGTIVLIEK
jgi:murein L,D-transpeptidase YafK